jgi:hypothetical protein
MVVIARKIAGNRQDFSRFSKNDEICTEATPDFWARFFLFEGGGREGAQYI